MNRADVDELELTPLQLELLELFAEAATLGSGYVAATQGIRVHRSRHRPPRTRRPPAQPVVDHELALRLEACKLALEQTRAWERATNTDLARGAKNGCFRKAAA